MSNELEPIYAGEAGAVEVEGEEQNHFLSGIAGQTPWWIVSVLMHALIITLAALLSVVIELPDDFNAIPIVTIFDPPKQMVMNEPPKEDITNKPTDPRNPSNGEGENGEDVIIPPDVLANFIQGDMFKTKTNEPFEIEGARGDENAHIFHGAFVGETGGGGTWGNELSDVSIGPGAGSTGKDGGWGGGEGGGVGPDKGTGFASKGFRNRGSRENMVRKHNKNNGSPLIPIKSCDLGLQWLAYHQEADGHWDAKKYEAAVKTDTAVTGLALLAFLGAGHTEKVGEFRVNVKKAVEWLKSKQAADGCIWDTSDDSAGHRRVGYPSAIATLALAEAAGMANIPDTKAAAQKAIDYCTEIHQFGDGYDKLGWRYAPKSEGDLSVSGWFIMALKSAKVAGLKVNERAFGGAMKFLDSVEVKENAGSAYSASHYKYMANQEHGNTAHRLTAIGTLARQFLGWKKEDLQGSVDWFVNKGGVPSYGANGESCDLYYWYYGTMCVFQQGGDVWTRWNVAMLKAFTENQCKQGDANGSWNPTGEFSSEWGRVGQTALSALCLEVYYRYDQLKSMK